MRDYITIGSTPCNEDCAQVGRDNYDEKSRKECQAFKNQLIRKFGEPPHGARVSIKSFPHDFGSYREVVCYYDDVIPESVEYAYKLEGDSAEAWDTDALIELSGTPKLDFDTWMRKVNGCVAERCGLSADDLPDKPYRDWYDSGMTPQDAAVEVISDEAPFLL